jgi:hypothetical protein
MAAQDTTIIPAANGEATTNVVALPIPPEPVTPSEKALSFVKEHPVLTLAGGVVAGLLISSLVPRRANRRLRNRAYRVAEAGATAALSFGRSSLDKAEDGGLFARNKARIVATQAEKFGERASARAERYSALAAKRAEKLSEKAVVQAERFGVAALGTASAWGHVAAERADKLGHAAAYHAENLGGRASDRLSQFGDKALDKSSELFGYPKAHRKLGARILDKVRDLLDGLRR